MIKNYKIVIDGIDKTGKDLVKSYLFYLGKAKYLAYARGAISLIAYAKRYNRDYEYDITCEENIINIYLTVNKEDWEIRCKTTNEPKLDFEKDIECFEFAKNQLKTSGKIVLEFNTSEMTPYNIAKAIIDYAEKINKHEHNTK